MSRAGELNWTTTWQEAQDHGGTGSHLAGWIGVGERNLYHGLAKAMKPGQTFVEIGTYGGTTPALVALVAPAGVSIIVIDPFTNKTHEECQRRNGVPEDLIVTLEEVCRDNWKCCGVDGDIELIVESSHSVGPQWNRPIDWLIVDGDHSADGCYMDLVQFAPWVKSGGLLVVDDYLEEHEGVREGTDRWWYGQPEGAWKREWEIKDREAGTTLGLRKR